MTSKECPKCGDTMSQEEVLTGPTTHANVDDMWGKEWQCECGEVEEIEEEL